MDETTSVERNLIVGTATAKVKAFVNARRWRARAFRSTRMSVELPCAAISADAMTVLPEPGGATSTASSWLASSSTAARWMPVSVALKGSPAFYRRTARR
jgi:hypothetical protein